MQGLIPSRKLLAPMILLFAIPIVLGCNSFRPFAPREFSWQLNAPNSQNPIFVQAENHEVLWTVLVDVIDSHFEILHEKPIRLYDNVLTEGRLDTKPKIGASLGELWYADSVGIHERIDCTLQTIRRRGVVRVVPEIGGYLIEVLIYKELEDMKTPTGANSNVSNLRFQDDVDRFSEMIDIDPSSSGWIMIGRDNGLEERLLQEIVYRLKHPSGIIRKAKDPIRG